MDITIVILFFCACGLVGLLFLLFASTKEDTIDVEKYLNFYKLEIEKQKELLQQGNKKRNKLERKIQSCRRKLNLK